MFIIELTKYLTVKYCNFVWADEGQSVAPLSSKGAVLKHSCVKLIILTFQKVTIAFYTTALH